MFNQDFVEKACSEPEGCISAGGPYMKPGRIILAEGYIHPVGAVPFKEVACSHELPHSGNKTEFVALDVPQGMSLKRWRLVIEEITDENS